MQRRLFARQLERLLSNMALRLQSTAVSLSLASGQELACAFVTADGRSIAEAGDPLLSGSLGAQIAALFAGLAANPISGAAREAIWAINDPYEGRGGVDVATLTLLAPLFSGDEPGCRGYLALRARYPALPFGGPLPLGELPPAPDSAMMALPPAVGPRYAGFAAAPAPTSPPRTVEEEGRRLPLTLLHDGLLRELCRGARSPRERLGDLLAHRAALRFGMERLRELFSRLGAERFAALGESVLAHGAEECRGALSRLAEGVYAFADSLDNDATGRTDIGIRATCTLRGGQLQVDLRESDDAVPGPLNIVAPTVAAVVRLALLRFLPATVTPNDGLLLPVRILLRPGSLLDAHPPFALALGLDETARRLYDVLLGALAQAAPKQAAAAGCGTTSSLFLSWPGAGFVHRERLPGGSGGSADGTIAHSPAALRLLGRSLPAESLERRLPVRIWQHAVRRGSGGGGIHSGTDGEIREVELLAALDVTLAGERRRRPPYGLAGGGPGAIGRDRLERQAEHRAPRTLPEKLGFQGRIGDRLILESPGGGGYGDPQRAAFYAALLT